MTASDFFGCALMAFGPPLAMFSFTIAIEPIRIIIFIASTFFWLISLLLSSTVWYIITPLQKYIWTGLVYSVIFQEIFRYLLYKVMRRAERGLEKVTTAQVADCRDVFAFVCGLGFGIMSGAFSLVNVLADAIGPGTVGLFQGNEYFFLVSAATTLCFIMLHTFWGIILFAACDANNWFQVTWVVASHMFVSFMTILNSYQLYTASVLTIYTVLLVNTVVAYNVAGGRVQGLLQYIVEQ